MAPRNHHLKALRLAGAAVASFGLLGVVGAGHDVIPHDHPWDALSAHAAEAGERYISDLSPNLSSGARLDADADGGSLVLGGQTHAKGIGMKVDGDYASATLPLPAGCTGFAATIGHDNNSDGTNFRFRVMRLSPGFVEFHNQTISRGDSPSTIAVPVTAGQIILEGAGSGMGDWGSARFTGCSGGATPTVPPTATAAPPTATPPSATPTSPPTSGYCSAAVHDAYTTTGPSGQPFPTWHPQRHESGCYFGHDHGSDPTLFHPTWKPAYGAVAIAAAFPEPHEGFKGYALPQFGQYRWYITHHFGTAGAGRVCTRFHEIQWAVVDTTTGQIAAHLAFMGDYGRAENNDTGAHYHPAACPNQASQAIADESFAVRQIPMGPTGTDYEPWRIDGHKIVNVLGFDPQDFVINTRDSLTRCVDLACNQLMQSPPRPDGVPRMGDDRFVTNNGTGAQFKGTKSGAFATNAFGTGGGSFPQFIAAGLTARIPTTGSPDNTLPHCRYVAENRMSMLCDSQDNPVNIDRKLKSPN